MSIGDDLKTALTALLAAFDKYLDAVATYQSHEKHVARLERACEDVNKALSMLEQHQQNHELITQLNEGTQRADSELRNRMKQLVQLRQRLNQLPKPSKVSVPESQKEVSYSELLAYATKISKFTTAPPGYAQAAHAAATAAASADAESQPKLDSPDPDNNRIVPPEYSKPITSVPANFPWPSEDEMRRGCLAEYNLKSLKTERPVENNNLAVEQPHTVTKDESMSPTAHVPMENTNTTVDLDLYDPDDEN
ncbi:hypothetical protein CANCADRAFT_56786 [Tortispora caseinolytica NRRL Y-17796]|uniref:Mediator of RNA polymerase II transcription subunit 4 n=1 Tax=Tortispora caseinolytica NRRL Y-17796 TaxID=767744 RepID=A0A1E4TEN5_9ASCO|nr:hypothetical protein CANCADRAFT_56786 [Tortispora caseinolytica NRRL Y-17796]